MKAIEGNVIENKTYARTINGTKVQILRDLGSDCFLIEALSSRTDGSKTMIARSDLVFE
jgi:hypothetical protein